MLDTPADNQIDTQPKLAIVLLNANGEIIDAHPSCASSLDWTRDELIGQNVKTILESGRDALLRQLFEMDNPAREPTGDTTFSIRIVVKKRGGEVFPALVTVRRFLQLGCWTAVFQPWNPQSTHPPTDHKMIEPDLPPEDFQHSSLSRVSPASSDSSLLDPQINTPCFRSISLLSLSARRNDELHPAEEANHSSDLDDPSRTRADEVNSIDNPATGPSEPEQKPMETPPSALSVQFQALLQVMNETLEAERSYQEKIYQLEDRNKDLQAYVAELKEALEAANNERSAAEARFSALIAENNALLAERSQLAEAKAALQRIRDDIESQLQAFPTPGLAEDLRPFQA